MAEGFRCQLLGYEASASSTSKQEEVPVNKAEAKTRDIARTRGLSLPNEWGGLGGLSFLSKNVQNHN